MSIRLRLALWYTAVLAVTLIAFSSLLYFLMVQHLIGERDESIASRARHIAGSVNVVAAESDVVQRIELPPIDVFESPGVFVQVVQRDGVVVAHSDSLGGQDLPGDERAFAVARTGYGAIYTTTVGATRMRIYVQPILVEQRPVAFVQVGRSYAEAYALLGRLRLGLVGFGVVSLLLAGGIARAVAGRALKPIATITSTARAITLSKGFSRRFKDSGSRDELGRLGITFNEMLASLEEAYTTQQRFVADASHELRAPLAAVQANLELLYRQGDNLPGEERRALVKAASNEANRMARLVADLLSLARADAGQRLEKRKVEVDRLLVEVYGEVRELAKGIKLTICEIDQVSLLADPDRLKQLLLILVDNASRYTPTGGNVRLSLRKDDMAATLEVADDGIGISAQDLPHIFERFYRVDKARARDAGGTGLGLAIAKWIVEQHGGDVAVESTLGKGSTFTVRLPLQGSSFQF
ncbi:MAG: HAMP domain-containing protein [Chloroflexi bacterium]|nr:HAMP domain-containing protein [Chloroflexota bacterium]